MTNLVETVSVRMAYPFSEGILTLYEEGVSLMVGNGDFVAVLGGSGWGKSTLVNVILGLERPTGGTVYFRGEDVTTSSFVKRCGLVRTSAVFQRPTALPQLTVSQNLHLALSLAGISKRERNERVKESLGFFGMDGLERAYPDSLSAGQRRRIDLARALAIKPQLLVIDEPTGDLDTSAENIVLPLLRGLNRDYQISVLITTALPRCASIAKRMLRLKPPSITAPVNKTVGL